MSTREIYNLSHKPGVFIFAGGQKNEGMLVPHYNISLAKIEYFFIPSSSVNAYLKAKENHVRDAYRFYGNMVDETTIHSILE